MLKISWVPVRNVVHSNYSDLIAIRGHKNFYGNLLNGKITYRKGNTKISTGETTISKAKKFVEDQFKRNEGQSELQIKIGNEKAISPLFSDVWEEFLGFKLAGKQAATCKTYHKNYNVVFKPFFEKKTVLSINYPVILEFKKWYLKEYPKRYFRKTLIHLQAMLKYAQKMKYIDSIPDLSDLKEIDDLTSKNNKKKWQSNSKTFTNKEVKNLLVKALLLKKPNSASAVHLGILLGVMCGLRKMEALSIKWEDDGVGSSFVDLKKKELRIWSSKNGEHRVIPCPKMVVDAIIRHKEFCKESPWVFPQPTNHSKHTSGQNFDKIWVRTKELAEVVGRFHDLRHTFATRTAELGWSPILACEILDMSLDVYQKRYCKPSAASKKLLMDQKIYET